MATLCASDDDGAPHRFSQLIARAALEESQQRFSQAFTLYEEAFRFANSKDGQDLAAIGRSLEGMERCLRHLSLTDQADKCRAKLAEITFLQRSKYADDVSRRYLDQGNYAESEKLLRESLEALVTSGYEERSGTATVMDNLATTLRCLGRLDEALPHAEHALEIRRRRLPDGHPHVAASCSNLGFLYHLMGRCDEAERLLRESLDVRLKTPSVGADHVDAAESHDRLSLVLKQQGKLEESKAHCRKAVDIRRETLGVGHPLTKTSEERLAVIEKQERSSRPEPRSFWEELKNAIGPEPRVEPQDRSQAGKGLTAAEASKLVKNYEVLRLNLVTVLTVEVAEVLGSHQGLLALNGLADLPSRIARALRKHSGELQLDGVRQLTVNGAAALAHHKGRLTLKGLRSLDDDSAGWLNKHNGGLDLTGLMLASKASVALLRANPQVELSPDLGEGQ